MNQIVFVIFVIIMLLITIIYLINKNPPTKWSKGLYGFI